jgi:uncharacterized protein (TIGR00369 family)
MILARQFCDAVPHSRDLGMEILPMEGDSVRMRAPPQPHLLGDAGTATICSSVLYSLADSVGGLAVLTATRALEPIATLDLRMNYLRPAPGHGAVVAAARCEHITEDVAFVRCAVYSEPDRALVATGDAAFMRGTSGIRFDVAPETVRVAGSPAPSSSKTAAPSGLQPGGDMPYARHLGLDVQAQGGPLRVHLPYRDALIGNVMLPALHGGVLGGLIEGTASLAAREGSDSIRPPQILNCNIDYLRSAGPQSTYASAEITRRTRRTMLVHVYCWQSDARSPVATGRVQLLLGAPAARAGSAAQGNA